MRHQKAELCGVRADHFKQKTISELFEATALSYVFLFRLLSDKTQTYGLSFTSLSIGIMSDL